MFWQKEYECMDREDLEQLQLERLQATVNRVSRNVPFYRDKFRELDMDPYDLTSLDDIKSLPLTTKDDIRDNYPYGLFAVPLREVVRLQTSSGTTGKPTVVGYTRNDVTRWADLVARVLVAGGVTKDDKVQIAFGYGLFTGGFGFHYGAERLGASVIPSSSGNARRQVMIMQDYKTTTLCCTPSYALHLADTMDEMGVNPNALDLRWGLFGAESWSEGMRQQIEDRLKLAAMDNYGTSEIMGPGVAAECLERKGLHVNEDHFYMEIIDPETLQPLPHGETGELVITTLTKEAFPMIRFRTGDLTRIISEPCACGRTFHRIHRILGRTDDMFIIKGVNVYPSQVEQVLLDFTGTLPQHLIVLERDGHLDRAILQVEASWDIATDCIREYDRLIEELKKRLHTELGVSFEVKVVEADSLVRSEGKVVRVDDRRAI